MWGGVEEFSRGGEEWEIGETRRNEARNLRRAFTSLGKKNMELKGSGRRRKRAKNIPPKFDPLLPPFPYYRHHHQCSS